MNNENKIEIKQIGTRDPFYSFVENLFITSFPVEERRELSSQRILIDNSLVFSCNVLLLGDEPIGLINYWNLKEVCYIEHFAISPELRSRGYGSKVISTLEELTKSSLLLEVELPRDEWSQRRIDFYQRIGFSLCEISYSQPPYHVGEPKLPLLLMSKGFVIDHSNFDEIKKLLYKEVYNYIE